MESESKKRLEEIRLDADRETLGDFRATLEGLRDGSIGLPRQADCYLVQVRGTRYVLVLEIDSDLIARVKDITICDIQR